MKNGNVRLANIEALNESEVEEVSGGILANIGMGVVGAAAWMAGYGISSWGNGLSGSGFLSAAAGGFVAGAGGFTPLSNTAGGVVAGGVGYVASGGGSSGGSSTVVTEPVTIKE